MKGMDSSRLLVRLAVWLVLGGCFAFWPLAGYTTAAIFATPKSEINSPSQSALVVTKSANTSEASAGDTIIYSYLLTNTGTDILFAITATDDRLGPVVGLAVDSLAPGLTATAVLTYVVQVADPAGLLTNTVTVTGTNSAEDPIVASDSASVLIVDPTSLPEREQPSQRQPSIFLPLILPPEE